MELWSWWIASCADSDVVVAAGQVACDVCIGGVNALLNTALLKYYGQVDPRVRPLVFAVKYWAKQRGINDSVNGTLSSYVTLRGHAAAGSTHRFSEPAVADEDLGAARATAVDASDGAAVHVRHVGDELGWGATRRVFRLLRAPLQHGGRGREHSNGEGVVEDDEVESPGFLATEHRGSLRAGP
ncbi:hypothetical protein ON010_g18959 [Phytophthora cinnamomi]|nr:hypothetical protein ON010_g18959 [Phytophthora cinnamomi]